MAYNEEFYRKYRSYLLEPAVRRAHSFMFEMFHKFTGDRQLRIMDLGCGTCELATFNRPHARYAGIDIYPVDDHVIVADFMQTHPDGLVNLCGFNPDAFASLFATEPLLTDRKRYEFYERLFRHIPGLHFGLVSGFIYRNRSYHYSVVEPGSIRSYQTIERQFDVMNPLFTEFRCFIEAPSEMFGKDVVEVWKFLRRKDDAAVDLSSRRHGDPGEHHRLDAGQQGNRSDATPAVPGGDPVRDTGRIPGGFGTVPVGQAAALKAAYWEPVPPPTDPSIKTGIITEPRKGYRRVAGMPGMWEPIEESAPLTRRAFDETAETTHMPAPGQWVVIEKFLQQQQEKQAEEKQSKPKPKGPLSSMEVLMGTLVLFLLAATSAIIGGIYAGTIGMVVGGAIGVAFVTFMLRDSSMVATEQYWLRIRSSLALLADKFWQRIKPKLIACRKFILNKSDPDYKPPEHPVLVEPGQTVLGSGFMDRGIEAIRKVIYRYYIKTCCYWDHHEPVNILENNHLFTRCDHCNQMIEVQLWNVRKKDEVPWKKDEVPYGPWPVFKGGKDGSGVPERAGDGNTTDRGVRPGADAERGSVERPGLIQGRPPSGEATGGSMPPGGEIPRPAVGKGPA
jgi:hypothetical protein